jgi:3',5'-cyclic-AMP phosphodiesterase
MKLGHILARGQIHDSTLAKVAMKLIHITDTHFVKPGEKLYGLDPRARLDAAIADINAHHADADLAVVTGDLTHWGEPEAYSSFRDTMSALKVPYNALVGNHDKRANCLYALPAAPQDQNGFVQGFRDMPHGRLLFLDTLDEGSGAGQLCSKRLAWIEANLESTKPDQSIFLFMHHPPFEVGVHDMDRIALAEREAFFEVISPYLRRIRHIFFGHVHRPISGSWRSIAFSTLRGTNHQVWFNLDKDCQHLASHEPPAYGVVLVSATTTVVHAHDFLDSSPRFPFSIPDGDNRAYQLGPVQAVN